MDEDHSTELQDMDDSNNKKLMTEYEKYQELQARSLKLQEVTSSHSPPSHRVGVKKTSVSLHSVLRQQNGTFSSNSH